jgi:CBS domain-containing protein
VKHSRQPSPFDVPLRRLVQFKLHAIRQSASIGGLHQRFADTKATHAVVVDDRGRAPGLVSRGELCARAADGEARTVAGVLPAGVVTVPAIMTVAEASARMMRRGCRRWS